MKVVFFVVLLSTFFYHHICRSNLWFETFDRHVTLNWDFGWHDCNSYSCTKEKPSWNLSLFSSNYIIRWYHVYIEINKQVKSYWHEQHWKIKLLTLKTIINQLKPLVYLNNPSKHWFSYVFREYRKRPCHKRG